MITMFLLAVLALPQGEVEAFCGRVAEAIPQASAEPVAARVLLRVEDPGGAGAGEELRQCLREALRARNLEAVSEGEAAWQVHAYLARRAGRPLAVARISGPGREPAVLFALFPPGVAAEGVSPGGPAVAIRTRRLFASLLPVLDLEADAAGNLFVLHPDRIRVYDLNTASVPLKAEVGVDSGADRLRDPLVRLVARDTPRQLELYTAALSVPQPPPVPLEGYALKTFAASARMRVAHPWRGVSVQLQPVSGRNYFRGTTVPQLYAAAPVLSPLRAHWAVLDTAGRLQLADADLRPFGPYATGAFGSDAASASLPCAGTLVLATSADAAPARDRITVLRVENDRLLPYTTLEVEGAVYRLKAVPAAGEERRILAVAETGDARHIEEIELRCAP